MKSTINENKMAGLFSVIMPTHNRATLIEEGLDSIKAQTYRPIEIVVVDDGSTDETGIVIQEWQERNTENNGFTLRYLYQENAGASAARNRGIGSIEGEYIQYLDSDDLLAPNRLQVLAETFKNSNCDFIQTGFKGFDAETGEVIQTLYGNPNEDQLELALNGRLWANTLRSAFTAELVKRLGPWKSEMSCFEDREYVERAICAARKPVAIREVLASARRGGGKRISDKLRSYEGRVWRVYCEQCLAEATRCRSDISYASKKAFASRIYGLGFRSNASGWPDLGKQCEEIAASMGVKLDNLGKRRRLVWRLGKCGGLFYRYLGIAKMRILGR